MILTAMSVSPDGTMMFSELTAAQDEQRRSLSALIGAELAEPAHLSLPEDAYTMWFDPGESTEPPPPPNAVATALGIPVHGTVVFTGPMNSAAEIIIPLGQRCIDHIILAGAHT